MKSQWGAVLSTAKDKSSGQGAGSHSELPSEGRHGTLLGSDTNLFSCYRPSVAKHLTVDWEMFLPEGIWDLSSPREPDCTLMLSNQTSMGDVLIYELEKHMFRGA